MRFTLELLVVVLLVGLTLGTPGTLVGDQVLAPQATPEEAVETPQGPLVLPAPEAAESCKGVPAESADNPAVDNEAIDFGALSGRVAASCNYCTSRQECYSVCGSTDVACVYDPYCGEGRWCACFF